jgi:hypothetical protein
MSELHLVRINHIHCGEEQGFTLIWAPAEMSEAQVKFAVRRAQEAYFQMARKFRAQPPPNDYHYGYVPYRDYPQMTVAEIDRLWEEKKAVYEAWRNELLKAERPFLDYLEEEGLLGFWRHDPALVVKANWGHHHGESVDTSETEIMQVVGRKVRYDP